MALRTSRPGRVTPLVAHEVNRRPVEARPAAADDRLSAARGILYAALGGAAVWAALIGGVIAVIQRLR